MDIMAVDRISKNFDAFSLPKESYRDIFRRVLSADISGVPSEARIEWISSRVNLCNDADMYDLLHGSWSIMAVLSGNCDLSLEKFDILPRSKECCNTFLSAKIALSNVKCRVKYRLANESTGLVCVSTKR